MFLSDTSVKRPVLASMVSLALVLFGAIGYTQLCVREFPDVDPPIVSVTTVLPGANPQVMESAVTDILEEELSTVEGLRTLTSVQRRAVQQHHARVQPRPGASRAPRRTCATRWPGCAAACREDVRRAGRRQAGRRRPAVLSGWRSPARTTTCSQLSDIGDRLVKQRLQTLPGVGQARHLRASAASRCGSGSRPRELAARGLTVQDVEQAIRSRNVEIPAGRIESDAPRVHRPLARRAQDPGGVRRPGGGQPGRPAGQAQGPRPGRARRPRTSAARSASTARRRWRVGVVRQSKANIIEVADAIRAALPRIQAVAAAGRHARHRLRPVDLRQALDPGGAGDAGPRRRPGRDHHLPVPAEPAGHDHPRPRDPDVHRRRPSRSCTSSASRSTTSRCSR